MTRRSGRDRRPPGHRRRRFAAVLAAMLVLVLTGSAAAQTTGDDEVQILSIDDSESPRIRMEIAIPPAIGEVAPTPAAFGLTDNGDRRDLQLRAQLGSAAVVLVIDVSGSMEGEALLAAKAGAADFIRSAPEGVEIAVVAFGSESEVVAELTTDRDLLISTIEGLSLAGETSLWDGLIDAAELLESRDVGGDYVVVLSDGADSASAADRADAEAALQAADASLYAVVLETAETSGSELSGVVERVGGQFLVSNTAGLATLYADIAQRLANRYLVVFRLDDDVADHAVVLSVAVDDAIATASTVLRIDAPVAPDVPSSLEQAAVPAELGAIVTAPTAWYQGSLLRWLGIGLLGTALLISASLLALPAVRFRPVADRPLGTSRLEAVGGRVVEAAGKVIDDRDGEGSFDRTLDAAGLSVRPGEFLVLHLAAMLALGLVGATIADLGGGIVGAGVGLVLGLLWVQVRIARRRAAFADDLIGTITIITGSLRAGRGLPQAIELVSQEAPEPTATEFSRVVIESRIGRDAVASLHAVADRMDNQDLHWIAQAININRELGGDLVEILDNVADTIRERIRIKRQVRALSAEGRASGWVLLALPVLLYAYMRAVNPDYVNLLHETTGGRWMLGLGLVAMAAGAMWIRKLVDLKY